MTSIFLAENTQDDGSITDEDNFCAAAATFFTGTYNCTVALQIVLTYTLSHRWGRYSGS